MNRLDDAIGAIYDAAVRPAGWPDALQKIADHFGDFGAVMIFGKEDGGFGVVASPSIVPMTQDYLRDWADRDVRAIRGRTRGYFINGNVLTDRHILTEEEMDREPHYRDFLALYGLRYFAAISISPTPQVEAALSIQRRMDRVPFSEAEMAQLSSLSTHVERALGLGIKLLDAALFNEGLLMAFDRIGHGVIALADGGRIVHANRIAQSLFGDGLHTRADHLWLDDRDADHRLRQQLTRAKPPVMGSADAAIVIRCRRRGALVLRLVPLARTDDSALANATFIALVTDAAEGGVIQPGLLEEIYALTRAEAKLAAIVGAGRSPSAAAALLGITDQTARSVLKRVFDKMGISRQGELVHLLSRLAVNA